MIIDDRANKLLECILFIAKTDQSIRLIDSDEFSHLLTQFNSNWKSPSHTTVINQYIPAIATAIKEYIISRLKGRSVTLILDETKNSHGLYINIIISVDSELSNNTEMYFWDCMESSGSTDREIIVKMCEVADELEDYDILCKAYAVGNCHIVIRKGEVCTTKSGRNISRVPCISHILNNIFRDFIERNRDISRTWSCVLLVCIL